MERTQARVVISGRVQGVGFRISTSHMAQRLGVRGWVKNRADDKVEAVFEGEKNAVKEIVSWCRKGPSFASVSNIDVDFREYTGEFRSFDVA